MLLKYIKINERVSNAVGLIKARAESYWANALSIRMMP